MAISPHQRHFAPSNPLNCKRFPDRHQLRRTLRDITKINVSEGSVTALTGGDIRPALGLWGVGARWVGGLGRSKSLAVIQGECNPVLFLCLAFFPRPGCSVPADVTADALSLALVHIGCRNKSEAEKKEACTIENVFFFFVV